MFIHLYTNTYQLSIANNIRIMVRSGLYLFLWLLLVLPISIFIIEIFFFLLPHLRDHWFLLALFGLFLSFLGPRLFLVFFILDFLGYKIVRQIFDSLKTFHLGQIKAQNISTWLICDKWSWVYLFVFIFFHDYEAIYSRSMLRFSFSILTVENIECSCISF